MNDWGNVISVKIGRKVKSANDVDRVAMETLPLHTDVFPASATVMAIKIWVSVMSATVSAIARTIPRDSIVNCALPATTEILEAAVNAITNVNHAEY